MTRWNLQTTPPPMIIAECRRTGLDGRLVFEIADYKVTLQIRRGEILVVTSSAYAHRFANWLVARGHLAEDQVEAAVAALVRAESLGKGLERIGALSAEELVLERQALALAILVDLFRQDNGSARAESGGLDMGSTRFLKAETPALMYRVISHLEEAHVSRLIHLVPSHLEKRPGMAEFAPIQLTPEEQRVWSSWPRVISPSTPPIGVDVLTHRRLALVLSMARWLVPAAAPSAEPADVRPPGSRARFTSRRPAGDRSDALRQQAEDWSKAALYEILNVSRDARTEEISSSWKAARSQLEVESDAPDARFYAKKALALLDEAHSILTNPIHRQTHDKLLDRTPGGHIGRKELDKFHSLRSAARENHRKARRLADKGQLIEAIRLLDQAIGFDPGNVDHLVLLGECQLHLPPKREEGRLTLERALRVDPSSVRARTLLAQEEIRLGNKDTAERLLKEIMELAPETPGILQKLARLKRGG